MSEAIEVLLVEDDDALREAIQVTLELEGVRFSVADNAEMAIDLLKRARPKMVVSDIRLPGLSGVDLLKRCKADYEDLPVVLMTAFAETKIAVDALRAGARDFLLKPFRPEQLIEVIRRHAPSACESPELKADLIAVDPTSLQLMQKVGRVARTDTTVLLLGESGSGKEVIARHLHQRSLRAGKAFIAINCAAIPSTLLEATLFGHEKGAFTGAMKGQSGKFELAQGGTIFLDEIGEMPLELQSKILRVLQERQVERVGSHQTIDLDVRVVAATNQDLAMRVSNGQFREDLYYRINVFPIKIPPLRDRPGDILALAERYLLKYRESMGFPHANFTSECRRVLTTYRWPGNVRELENTVQRGLLLCDGFDIKPADIDLGFSDTAIPEPKTANSKGLPESAIDNSQKLRVPNTANANRLSEPGENDADFDRASSEVKIVGPNANSALAPKSAHEDLLQDLGVGSSDEEYSEAILGNSDIKQVERDHIIAVLKKVNGSRRKAVELLGISERTLRYKIKHWRASGIDIP